MQLKVLWNPSAGRGRTRRNLAEALLRLENAGATLDCEESRSPAHLSELAASASKAGYDRVVICGGDGSVNLTVRQFDLDTGVLGVIPLGSGDDFAKTIGITHGVHHACDAITGGKIREVDVAIANGMRYLGVAGLGFDSEVAAYAPNVKLLRGSLVYLYSIFRVLPTFEPRNVHVLVDGVERDEVIMFAAIGNIHRYGAGVQIVPQAVPDDGELDLCLVRRCTRFELLRTLPRAYAGKHVTSPFVSIERGRHFEFSSETEMKVYADGERVGTTPLTISIEPKRLRVAVPPVDARL